MKNFLKIIHILAAAVISALLSAAVLVFAWAWICYRLRLSTEVIKTGLLFLYILPCLIGVKAALLMKNLREIRKKGLCISHLL